MSRGIQRERAVRAWYADRDWLAFRAPASLGVADVIAMQARGTEPYVYPAVELVEVKSTHRGPFHSFGPADRQKLLLAARMAGATAVLAWWPPHGKLRFLYENEWPPAGRSHTPTPPMSGTAQTTVPREEDQT